MIESLYPYLILAGFTIGAVLLYLALQARSAGNVSLALIRLNEQLQFDAPAFLQGAWPLLAKGRLRGIAWRLDWFGVPIEQQHGALDGEILHKKIHVDDMTLSISFWTGKRGERRYFDESLIEMFLLLLRTDMWIKVSSTDAAFLHLSRLTLFVQHDMKNVAQFIQLMADQVDACPGGQEQRVLDYLRTATPLMRHRANRIVRTLTVDQSPVLQQRTMDLAKELAQMCLLHRLDCTIEGAASISTPESTLDSALDNILKNYSEARVREAGTPMVSIVIREREKMVEIVIEGVNTEPPEQMVRLFEPFWSSSEKGLGIGLYHARELVENCGGSLRALSGANGRLQFMVEVPLS